VFRTDLRTNGDFYLTQY